MHDGTAQGELARARVTVTRQDATPCTLTVRSTRAGPVSSLAKETPRSLTAPRDPASSLHPCPHLALLPQLEALKPAGQGWDSKVTHAGQASERGRPREFDSRLGASRHVGERDGRWGLWVHVMLSGIGV